MIFILKLKKPIIHVLSEVMKRKTVDLYSFIISKCYNFHAVLKTIKSNFKQYAINLSLFGLCNL